MAWKNVQYENGKMRTSESGGGSSTFADLEDVDLTNPQNGQVPKYNATTGKWENANESGGSGHTYSTTEQVVGTWIDGKPIYEKVVENLNYTASASWQNTGITIPNLDIVISCKFAQVQNSKLLSFVDYFICQNDGSDNVRAWSTSSNTYTYQMAIIQYTKTTDSASS